MCIYIYIETYYHIVYLNKRNVYQRIRGTSANRLTGSKVSISVIKDESSLQALRWVSITAFLYHYCFHMDVSENGACVYIYIYVHCVNTYVSYLNISINTHVYFYIYIRHM